MQPGWNSCLHGISLTLSPTTNFSLHTAQSSDASEASDFWSSLNSRSASTAFFEAGGGPCRLHTNKPYPSQDDAWFRDVCNSLGIVKEELVNDALQVLVGYIIANVSASSVVAEYQVVEVERR